MISGVARSRALAVLEEWHSDVGGELGNAKLNAYFAALATIGHARDQFPIERSVLITKNDQVARISYYVGKAMDRHGETRRLPSEKGRTTRSTVTRAESLADRLNAIQELRDVDSGQRDSILLELEGRIVVAVRRFLDQQALEVAIDLRLPGTAIVSAILRKANQHNFAGPVAQHLVGAKLAVRFPALEIENHSYTAADEQTGRRGDFQVGSSVFHVTVSEQPGHFEKCKRNLEHGLKPYLLVLERRLDAARVNFEEYGLVGKAGLYSIEAYVGQNLDELGEYNADGLRSSFGKLLAEYNRRVSEVEANRGLIIQIPDNLMD